MKVVFCLFFRFTTNFATAKLMVNQSRLAPKVEKVSLFSQGYIANSHAKNSFTKEASSSDGEESLSKIFSKKFCVLFCGSYS